MYESEQFDHPVIESYLAVVKSNHLTVDWGGRNKLPLIGFGLTPQTSQPQVTHLTQYEKGEPHGSPFLILEFDVHSLIYFRRTSRTTTLGSFSRVIPASLGETRNLRKPLGELVFKMNQKVTRKYDEYIYSMLMLSYCLSSSVLPRNELPLFSNTFYHSIIWLTFLIPVKCLDNRFITRDPLRSLRKKTMRLMKSIVNKLRFTYYV